jgi:hypothetical protein
MESEYRSESAGDKQTGLEDEEEKIEDMLGSDDSEGPEDKTGLEMRDLSEYPESVFVR